MDTITDVQLSQLSHKRQILFALFCAKQVIHLTSSPEAHKCIELVERWLEGRASMAECRDTSVEADVAAAAAPAHDYINTTAAYAAYSAIDAVSYTASPIYVANASFDAASDAAAYAANAAANAENRAHMVAEQARYYEELLHFDDMVERVLLEVKA